MVKVIVNIHPIEGITTEVGGRGAGKLSAKRTPQIGVKGGMGYTGGEMLCLAAGACFYNNLQRMALEHRVILKSVEVEVTATWDDDSPAAQEIHLRPKIEAEASEDQIRDLIQLALEDSSVANTIARSTPVRLDLTA